MTVREKTPTAQIALVAASAFAASLLFAIPAFAAQGSGHGDHSLAKVQTATVTAENSESAPNPAVDDGKNCGQSRKRLFVEGEGWIVRKVTTCY